MKVCQVLGGAEDGGLENHVVSLANGLAALGAQVTVIAHPRFKPRFAQGVAFVPLDLATPSRRNPWLRRRLRRRLAEVAPDVVHAHAGKATALIAATKPRAATVGTIHSVKNDLRPYRGMDAVIGVSPEVLTTLDHPRKSVVYNGASPPPEPTPRSELHRQFQAGIGTPISLAVGRLVFAKGYDRLIDFWDTDLGHLVIVGEGPERDALTALASGKPVTFAGHRDDARQLMGNADLLVCASRREGFGYMILEALMARLPVVSTPIHLAVEVLPAAHVAPIEGLRDAVARCLDDMDAARSRMAGAFRYARERLTEAHMIEATRKVYLDALRS